MTILLILNDAGLARTSLNGDEPMLCAWGNDDDEEWVMMTNDGDAATARRTMCCEITATVRTKYG